ncbi:hypothetical protein EK21DRAFT_85687 [Setomelanomma holmii]|uniref:Uncharacterized protein n=1 Tax=Setomelanomma holmii TaxID=210430 RepID=A0A9P4HJA3_9PLEO|nr:hypothetical protein EK21DRAFT_85687 [Setomelanomma holmii]
MIYHLFGACSSRRHSNVGGSTSASDSPLGSLVGTFGASKLCWEAKGSPREQFQQGLRGHITKSLNDYFGSIPGNEHFTISLYMIGRFTDTAIPTVMFISKSSESRKEARRAINESRIMSRYPEFGAVYVSKDPGSDNIVPLSSGIASEAKHRSGNNEVEGLPVYIRLYSSIRPATANAVVVGNRIFFQTVHHACRDDAPPSTMTTTAMDKDLEIDPDSESDGEDEREVLFHNTPDVAGIRRNMSTSPQSDSPETNCSGSSTYPSGTSTSPPVVALPEHIPDAAKIANRTSLHDGAARLEDAVRRINDTIEQPNPSVLAARNHDFRDPVQTLPESMLPLGRLFKNSELNDWVLIEITNPRIQEIIDSLLKNERSEVLAYGKIEVYIVRLHGPLAIGDCGSAIIDVNTDDTYGHVIAGCKTTGTAYILAAYQTAVEYQSLRLTPMSDVTYSQHSSYQRPGGPFLYFDSMTERCYNSIKAIGLPPNALPRVQNASEAGNPANSPFFASLDVKSWPRAFSGSHQPHDNRPCIDEVVNTVRSLGLEPAYDDAEHFLTSYHDDYSSLDVRNALRYLRSVQSNNLYDQIRSKKRGTAWLNDRTWDCPPSYAQSIAPEAIYSHSTNVAAGRESHDSTNMQHDAVDLATSGAKVLALGSVEYHQWQSSIADAIQTTVHASPQLQPCSQRSPSPLPFAHSPKHTRVYAAPLTQATSTLC